MNYKETAKCSRIACESAHKTLKYAIKSLKTTEKVIDTPDFEVAICLLCGMSCNWTEYNDKTYIDWQPINPSPRIWCTGMGKAGLVAHKLASTLCSNNVPASYIHAGEALHGDFGAIQDGDVLVAFSNSGKTNEVIQVADKAISQRKMVNTILITGERNELSKRAMVTLCYGKIEEACPLGLTPTTSIVVMLAIADALAMAVQTVKKLDYKTYAINHHSGYLGQISRQKSGN